MAHCLPKRKKNILVVYPAGYWVRRMYAFSLSLSFSSTATIKKTAGGWLGDRSGTYGGNGQSTTSLDGVSFSEGDLLLQVMHTMYPIQRLIPRQFTYHSLHFHRTTHLFTHTTPVSTLMPSINTLHLISHSKWPSSLCVCACAR